MYESSLTEAKSNRTFFFLKILFMYLFLERGEGREKERERSINVQLPLSSPLVGTAQACALLGIPPATLWFTGGHSIH